MAPSKYDPSWYSTRLPKTGQAGHDLLDRAIALGHPGPYQIQAAISALHAQGDSHESTDWGEITLLYGRLHDMQPSAVIALNGAVALSFAQGPEAGLDALTGLNEDGTLDRYQPFHAAHADLLRRAGRGTEAADAYGQALMYTENEAEQRFLRARLRALSTGEYSTRSCDNPILILH
jgi:RNA polymerase sigma-70 factor (ECF subfamily)